MFREESDNGIDVLWAIGLLCVILRYSVSCCGNRRKNNFIVAEK